MFHRFLQKESFKQFYKLSKLKKITIFLLNFHTFLTLAQNTGNLSIQFDNIVGNEDLVLGTKSYKNAMGEAFNITLFQYYISNIALIQSDGSEYVVPQVLSYFLIREQDSTTQTATLKNIPVGNYTAIRFIVGVDSMRNTANINRRKGCLDVGGEAKDMYWAWNSGYIFLKLEGISPNIPLVGTEKEPNLTYHIGLFGGIGDKKTLNNIRTSKVFFDGTQLGITDGQTTQLTIKTDILKIFKGSTTVRFSENPTVMTSDFSQKIADNYKNMFSFGNIKMMKTTK